MDACVLFSAPLRDLLIELASFGLYRAKWTEAIHREWIDNLLAARPDLDATKLRRTRDLMDVAVPDCLVERYEHLIDTLDLPDAGDRHVLAAAIAGRATCIVTFNVADFPHDRLAPHGIEAVHPDVFLGRHLDTNEEAVLTAARRCRTRLRHPPVLQSDYLTVLGRQRLSQTVQRLRHHIARI